MIIAKYLVKNILEKPLRTALLVICMGCCSFVAILSLDVVGNIEYLVKSMLTQNLGSSDMILQDSVGLEEEVPLSMENDQLLLYSMNGGSITFAEGEYTYYHITPFSISFFDYEQAVKMRMLPEALSLAEDEAAVTALFEKRNGYHKGDSITLYDEGEEPHEYKIVKVLPAAGIANGRNAVYLSEQGYDKLMGHKRANLVYLDICDDALIAQAKEEAKELLFNADVQVIMEGEEMKSQIAMIGTMFFLIFMICFFLVIFVSFSLSNRIVCERMAVVGTFRSLGLSAGFAVRILLLENALYGVLGAAIGTGLYGCARNALFSGLFTVEASSGMEVNVAARPLSALLYLAVYLLGAGIMMICPLKEILGTAKTAIRDIIFDNKDTAYRMGRFTKVTGMICGGIAIVTFFLKKIIAAQFLCFGCLLVAAAMLFPYVLKAASDVLEAFFEKQNMPIARLAALQCYARKSTVGSAILCVTSAILAIIIFIFLSTLDSAYDVHPYACDVHAMMEGNQNPAYFTYIKDLEGVEETELIYCRSTEIKINDQKKEVTVFGMGEGGFSLFAAIKDAPAVIEKDSFLMDKGLAQRMGLSVGDEVDFMFDADSYMPITKRMKLQALANCYEYDTTGNVVVLSLDLFIDMYHDYPGEVLVKCQNPEEIVQKIGGYSGPMLSLVETVEEYQKEWENKDKRLTGIIIGVILFGVGLAVVGMVSCLLIGFEGRRRECAVLISTSMPREKLARMFLIESMISAGASLVTALPAALIAFIPLRRIMEALTTSLAPVYNIPLYLLFLLGLWILYTGAAMSPIRKLKKMRLAEQLKYE